MVLKEFGSENVTDLAIQFLVNERFGRYEEDISRASKQFLTDNQKVIRTLIERSSKVGVNPLKARDIVQAHLKDLLYISNIKSVDDFINRLMILYGRDVADRAGNMKTVLTEAIYIRWITQSLLNVFIIQASRSLNKNCIEGSLKYAPIPIDQYTLDYVKHLTDPFSLCGIKSVCNSFEDLVHICNVFESSALKDSNGKMVDCFLVQYLILRVKFDILGGRLDE